MAIKPWVVDQQHGGWVIATITLANGDTSEALILPNYPQKTFHVLPDTGVTITVLTVEGSNIDNAPTLATNDADYEALHRVDDPTATFSALAAALLADILENPQFIKATTVTTSGGSTDITISVIAYTSR